MTPTEAFTIGFLDKCAADGCSIEQTRARMERFTKMADGGIMGAARGMYDFGKGAINTGVGLGTGALGMGLKGLLLSAGVGAGVGAAGGYGLASAMDDGIGPDEVKNEELIAEYRRAIQDLARRRQLGLA